MKALNPSNLKDFVPYNFERGEILNVNKPEGWTSFDIVKKIRNIIKIKKVGHAGTLDPFAVGVLLICTGRATKKVAELMKLEKEYLAIIELGKVTDTYDRTGLVIKNTTPTKFKLCDLKRVCNSFVGEFYQTPPMYSAVKVNGQRLYNLARRGEVIERKPRKVKILNIEILNYQNPCITLKVVCSRGTYIRTLANDIGEILDCGACLKELTRTRIGSYKIENAYSIANFERLVKSC
ncbi:MAG: tRNA pseudouridine(55) synthase TruB [bacterium]